MSGIFRKGNPIKAMNTRFLRESEMMHASSVFPRLSLLLLFLLPRVDAVVQGQGLDSPRQAEDSLSHILLKINQAIDDSTRNLLNGTFIRTLSESLKLPESDDYPFDSLRTLAKITSDDHKFRIFHWNLPTADGRHRYFGFLKLLDKKPAVIWPLRDFSDSIRSPETEILDNLHWFGALYYRIIPGETERGQKYYTLLGWAGKNPGLTRKVIEILSFDGQDRPIFGLRVFPGYRDGKHARVVFRYSASASMSLKYEEQPLKQAGSKSKKAWLIIFDRLIPLDPQLEGQYQFYVAAGDLFDGFISEHGAWRFIGNIEPYGKAASGRNPVH
jgi:hypothetical protein